MYRERRNPDAGPTPEEVLLGVLDGTPAAVLIAAVLLAALCLGVLHCAAGFGGVEIYQCRPNGAGR